jgi:hypothetical protein
VIWIKKLLPLALFCLLSAQPLASLSPEESADYWAEQRAYYQQYPAWEIETPAIIAWLNELEKSENELNQAQRELRKAKSELNQLKVESDKLQKSLEVQQSLLVTSGVAVAVLTVIVILK